MRKFIKPISYKLHITAVQQKGSPVVYEIKVF